ncbi:Hypothetical protein PHPALM_8612 [Phytophthora palmivora]|uniref:Uncharacterized protein n=1 Tax=Phytophthora palmivora TaxID=4796 RepID=A0A2P4Y9D7_9STRA|nr:Hypothetical protein PHPALM_8612 [Phytophthora palmivora]
MSLDLYNSAAKLPDEVVVPLLRSLKDTDGQTYGLQTADGPTEAICLSDRAIAEFRLRRNQPSELTHEVWYTANVGMVPGTFPSGNLATTWDAVTRGIRAAKYRDWQVLAYESAIDTDLLYKEQELYTDWLSRQPPAVEPKQYHWPKGVKERPPEAKKGKQLTCTERWVAVDAEKKATDTPGTIAESKGFDSDDPGGLAELERINSAMEPPSEYCT